MSDFNAKPSYLGKIYRATSGAPGSPVYSEISRARDISQNDVTRKTYEAAPRVMDYDGYILGRGDHNLVVQIPNNSTETHWEAFEDAFHAGADADASLLYLAVVSGPIATVGTRGMKGFFIISGKSEPYPVDGVMVTDWTLKPAAHATSQLSRVQIDA